MEVDSFKYLPRSFRSEYEQVVDAPDEPAWAPMTVPIQEATIALITTAGLYLRDSQAPFDVDRERREPMWGDPTYRVIPRTVSQGQMGASHLHLNTDVYADDFNAALPIRAFIELERAGRIGALAHNHYSFMGYQPRALTEWRDHYGPELVSRLEDEQVDAVVLAPA